MKRIGSTTFLLTLGLVLALFFVTVINFDIAGFRLSALDDVFAGPADQQLDDAQSRAALKEGPAAPADITSDSKPHHPIEPTVQIVYSSQTSKTERTEILGRALSSGSLRALQYIRSEFTDTLPEYRTEVLPVLKKRAAEGLLKRFSEEDWKGWLNSGTVLAGKPTAAFMYGSDVYMVNRELGRFIFSAGYLFHRAWAQASNGEPFDGRLELAKLIQDSARITREVSAGVSWGDLIDPSAAVDPVLSGFLDTIRFRLLERALAAEANNDVRALNLLQSLPDAPLPDTTVKSVSRFVRRISVAEDHTARDLLVGTEHKNMTLSHLATNHPQLRTPIAYLLLAVALDMHERGETADAATAAQFARQFDPAVLSDEQMALFSGTRPSLQSPPPVQKQPEPAAASGAFKVAPNSSDKEAAGGQAQPRAAEKSAVEKIDAAEENTAAPPSAKTGFRLDAPAPSAADGRQQSFPFGLIIICLLFVLAIGFGIKYGISKFNNRFGEVEFNEPMANQVANADFTLGDSINSIQGNHPRN